MIRNNGLSILSHLRKDSRKSLARISRETGIPLSTVFDNVGKLEKGVIRRYVSLINFSKIGYNLKVNFILKSGGKKEELKQFLISNQNVNSLLRLSGEFNFLVECIFKDMKDLEEFNDKLDGYDIRGKREHHIIDEIKTEGFIEGII